MSRALPDCLAGAGFLGHTWIVTIGRPAHPQLEVIRLQCNDAASAMREFDAIVASCEGFPQIYARGRKSWRRVSRAAAALEVRS